MVPFFFLRDIEIARVFAAFFHGLGCDQKPIGLANLPVIVKEGLSTSPFATKPTDSNSLTLVQSLDLQFFFDGLWIVLIAWIPDREQHQFLAVPQFLNAEVPFAPSADHEVGSRSRLFDDDFVVKRDCNGRGVGQVNGSTGDPFQLFVRLDVCRHQGCHGCQQDSNPTWQHPRKCSSHRLSSAQ